MFFVSVPFFLETTEFKATRMLDLQLEAYKKIFNGANWTTQVHISK